MLREVMRLFLLSIAILAACTPAYAAATADDPVIAIVIDDLGNNLEHGKQAVALPGPIACAVLPRTPDGKKLARAAHHAGKEVLLHLPVQSVGGFQLGPGGLTVNMTRRAFIDRIRADLAATPFVDGINNHMGSLLTRDPGDMGWLMTAIAQFDTPLFFVDSRTTARTVAYAIARERGISATWRDVFLDNIETAGAINKQLKRFVAIAKKRGTAVAIGHPYPVTLRVLAKWLPRLKDTGVRLVPVREVIARQADKPAPHKVLVEGLGTGG